MIMARPFRLPITFCTKLDLIARRAVLAKCSVSMPTGKASTLHLALPDREGKIAAVQAAFARQIAREVERVVAGLEADQIVLAQRRHQPLVVRQRGEHFRRRTGNVQEIADAVPVAARAQRLGERDQVIVVHPDEVVGPQQLVELVGEMLVDAHVAGEIAAREFGLIEAIVQDRPQHPVGEAVVVFPVVVGAEAGHHVVDIVVMDRRGLGRLALARDLAAPAEPDALPVTQRRLDGHLEAAGPAAGLAVRHRHAIGDYDEPRQYRSSQLFDKRSALRIRPAME